MSLKVEDAVPPLHLFSRRSAPWPSSYTSQSCPLGSSPALKCSQPHKHSRMHKSPMSSHNTSDQATGGWFDPSMAANDFQVCPTGHAHTQTTDTMASSTLDTNITLRLGLQWPFLHDQAHTRKEPRDPHPQHMPTHQPKDCPQCQCTRRAHYSVSLHISQ